MTELALLDLTERLEDAAEYLGASRPFDGAVLRAAARVLRDDIARSLGLAE